MLARVSLEDWTGRRSRPALLHRTKVAGHNTAVTTITNTNTHSWTNLIHYKVNYWFLKKVPTSLSGQCPACSPDKPFVLCAWHRPTSPPTSTHSLQTTPNNSVSRKCPHYGPTEENYWNFYIGKYFYYFRNWIVSNCLVFSITIILI